MHLTDSTMKRFLGTCAALMTLNGVCGIVGLNAGVAQAADGAFNAKLTKVVRQVEWQRATTSVWQPAILNNLLLPGDALRTGAGSHAEMLYGDGSVTRMGSLTSLVLTGDRRREVRLSAGKLWLQIQKGGAGMRILTPGAVATVTGTELLVEFDAARRATEVTVFEGSVNVNGDVGELVRVMAGTTTRVPLQSPAAVPVPLAPSKLQERSNLFKPLSLQDAPGESGDANPTQMDSSRDSAPDSALTRPGRQDGQEMGETSAPPPQAQPVEASGNAVENPKPDLKGQTDKLLDPRILNGSPTTGTVRVIIE